jgi:hypothetical protein
MYEVSKYSDRQVITSDHPEYNSWEHSKTEYFIERALIADLQNREREEKLQRKERNLE